MSELNHSRESILDNWIIIEILLITVPENVTIRREKFALETNASLHFSSLSLCLFNTRQNSPVVRISIVYAPSGNLHQVVWKYRQWIRMQNENDIIRSRRTIFWTNGTFNFNTERDDVALKGDPLAILLPSVASLKSICQDASDQRRRDQTRQTSRFVATRGDKNVNAWSGVIFTVYLTLSVSALFTRRRLPAAPVEREK